MKKQALKINSLGKHIYVKIPVCNSRGIFTGKIINFLSKKKLSLILLLYIQLDKQRKF